MAAVGSQKRVVNWHNKLYFRQCEVQKLSTGGDALIPPVPLRLCAVAGELEFAINELKIRIKIRPLL